ncbi:Hypothetical predicted protein [Mytilus galloprovincialis]|uniref:Uncharacterized protein n=1 Tax=Mytilus galloprovincialis TaxID=29158 RepID=A0A8B6FA75_MYTGA|nr:Hypothetical predicted protein [Mytilus galloprovincialis]
MDSDKLFVAAFDFGSTHSGYAFSARSSPNSIVTSKWEHNGLLFHKAPTSVLVNKKNEFVAFGFDAEDKYIMNMENSFWDSDDSDEETNDVNRYFNRFKMALHNETLNLKTMIKDQNGEEMKAIDIYAFAIKYLNKQVIRKLNTWEGGRWNVQTQDGHYVLTVPATWDDQAHIFMRKAAEQAGISGNQVTIALEHEAALTYCQVLRPYDQTDTNYTRTFHAIRRDKNYMVVDLGGGTFDITVHKRRSDGCLEEVVQPSRCNLGGTDIDIGIVRFLENVFGEQVMKELELKELEDYITLMHSEVSDIQQILMVGGFSECELVQKAMEDRFPNIAIFIPEKAGLAVLKGAVMYGHQHKQIRRHQNSAQVASVRTTRYGLKSFTFYSSKL